VTKDRLLALDHEALHLARTRAQVIAGALLGIAVGEGARR